MTSSRVPRGKKSLIQLYRRFITYAWKYFTNQRRVFPNNAPNSAAYQRHQFSLGKGASAYKACKCRAMGNFNRQRRSEGNRRLPELMNTRTPRVVTAAQHVTQRGAIPRHQFRSSPSCSRAGYDTAQVADCRLNQQHAQRERIAPHASGVDKTVYSPRRAGQQ